MQTQSKRYLNVRELINKFFDEINQDLVELLDDGDTGGYCYNRLLDELKIVINNIVTIIQRDMLGVNNNSDFKLQNIGRILYNKIDSLEYYDVKALEIWLKIYKFYKVNYWRVCLKDCQITEKREIVNLLLSRMDAVQ